MSNSSKRAGRRLSFLLRHADVTECVLSEEGWASCSDLRSELKITQADLKEIVETDNKGRFEFSKDGTRIRAVQGHSSPQVNRTFPDATPPSVLYHGTPVENIKSILEAGLQSRSRQYIHLSADLETAVSVGLRRTKRAAVLVLDAEKMKADGHVFYLAENGVWLVRKNIDPMYITIHEYHNK
ncbi:RNA 2'-phosphotransferase [compost metagenome]